MSIVNTLRFIVKHPVNRRRKLRALFDFARWQIGARIVPGDVVYPWLAGIRFIVRPGETGLTGNIYCGLQEFADMGYVLHVLQPDELFVDIGANVGAYTLLAAGVRRARCYAFEPVPATFARLMDNLRLNDITQQVAALNLGIADQEGELRFTSDENCMNHVAAEEDERKRCVKVPVQPLDHILQGAGPALIKIDVEGYETPVLDGARKTLANESLHSIIIELNGSGERYGFDERGIEQTLRGFGFRPFSYDPFERTLIEIPVPNSVGNTLFVRDVDRVRARLREAVAVQVKGMPV